MQHAQKSTVRIKFFKTLKQSKVYSKQASTKKKKKKNPGNFKTVENFTALNFSLSYLQTWLRGGPRDNRL